MLGKFWEAFFKKAGLEVEDDEIGKPVEVDSLKRTVSDAGPELSRLSAEVDKRSFFDTRRAE